ncbi:MAG: cytidine deaminase [Planctomycetota bacterium]|nr:cytidine deaminase [Planctomycetota bacterium]MDG1985971.1 cytidine deaminase [Planctomycetota bacterium]
MSEPFEPDEAAIARALEAARSVKDAAHAPYSRFLVGAAVLDAEGGLFRGCNVESASFGLTLCAERNALSTRIAELGGAGKGGEVSGPPITVVAIRTDAETPTAPCGACRQWLAELAPRAIVVAEAADGTLARWTVGDLLPDAFRGDQLGD